MCTQETGQKRMQDKHKIGALVRCIRFNPEIRGVIGVIASFPFRHESTEYMLVHLQKENKIVRGWKDQWEVISK